MTHERLTELLSYDKDSGQFVWLKTNSNRAKAGCVAGTERKDGYVLIGIDGVLYTAHRLAWFYVNNYWPDGVIDHINRDRSDNRFCNLRCVSRFENAQNANVSF